MESNYVVREYASKLKILNYSNSLIENAAINEKLSILGSA